jgi:zinc protease
MSALAIARDLIKIRAMERSVTRALASVTLVLASVTLVTQGCGSQAKQFAVSHAEKRATLPNGLKLVVIPDKSTPLVQVDVRYAVGGNEDPPGKAGLAHYVEHMMFQFRFFGEDGPPVFTVLPELTTIMNAYTSADRTHYWEGAPKENLEKLLDLEARRMRAARADCEKIPDKEFRREIDVVRNEIRLRGGTGEGLFLPTILETVYPKSHPYSHTPGGNDAQLVTLTKADVCQFMKDYYVPSRATLLVAGNVDPDEVGRLAAKYFGSIPDAKGKPRVEVPHVETKKARIEVELDIERPTVWIAWSLPAEDDPDSIKGILAASSLGFRAQRFASDWEFARSVGAFPLNSGQNNKSPILVLVAELYKNEDVDEALGYMWKAAEGAHRGLKEVRSTGAGTGLGGSAADDKEDISRSKARYIMGLESLNARTEEIANLMQFGSKTDFSGSSEYIIDKMRQMDEVKQESYRSYVKKALSKEKGTVFVFRKSKSGLSGDKRAAGKLADSVDVYGKVEPEFDPANADKPAPYPAKPSILADAERFELKNGMKVVLLPYKGLPIVSVRLMFGAGGSHEQAKKAGQAELAANFLQTPPANVFYKLGASYGAGAGMDSTSFSIRGIEIYLDPMLKSLERWVKAGAYEQRSIEFWQQNFKDTLKLPSVRLSHEKNMAVAAALYGPEHPYTLKGSATKDTYKKIGRDMLQAFRKKHYSAGNATMIITGSFDPAVARKAIKEHFGGWGKGHVDAQVSEPAVARTAPTHIGAVGRDTQNTEISIYYPGPRGIDKDYAARLLLSGILRQVMGQIRSELGSTYGVRGGWRESVGPSAYSLGGKVESMRAGESLIAIRAKVDKLRTEDFRVDFVRARRTLMMQLLAASATSGAQARTLAKIAQYNLPPDGHWQLIKQVANVKPEEVRALLNKELDPKKEIIVLEADKETLNKAFEAIGVTDFKLLEVAGE